jgi:heptaprenyl diphosphate synthase
MAALTAAALIVFIIEAQIPMPVPIQGAKLGLANAVTLFALFFARKNGQNADSLTVADAFMILICRIILGAAFTGRIIAFIYSLAGGLLGFAAQAAIRKFVTNRQIWVCGAIGAVFHNVGQILVAMLVTGTPSIAVLLPVLTAVGIITGIITGLVAQFAIKFLGGMHPR